MRVTQREHSRAFLGSALMDVTETLSRGDFAGAQRRAHDLAAEFGAEILAPLESGLHESVGAAWDKGWQPGDLGRVAQAKLDERTAQIVLAAVAGQANSYDDLGRRVAPRWMAQIDHMRIRIDRLDRVAGDLGDVVVSAVLGMAFLTRLRRQRPIVIPPSQWDESMAGSVEAGDVPEDVLAKVRALLAKAESSEFDAEADAFTAKAQQLMTRYRIDRLSVVGSGAVDESPEGLRIGIDDPYAEAKVLLLSQVAAANGCRAVWAKAFGSATVVGFAVDIAVVDELFTSLLLQSTAALGREGSKSDQRGRSRTRSFRKSFLVSYAERIGDRLRQASDDTVAEVDAEQSGALLPVLAARESEVEAAMAEMFPDVVTSSPRASDAEGWAKGRAAADRADLSVGERLPNRSV